MSYLANGTEVFYSNGAMTPAGDWSANGEWGDALAAPGWYWWSCSPGCLPEGEPFGPFETETTAREDATDDDSDDPPCAWCGQPLEDDDDPNDDPDDPSDPYHYCRESFCEGAARYASCREPQRRRK